MASILCVVTLAIIYLTLWAIDISNRLNEEKYYFITYQGERRDDDPHVAVWHDVTDVSPVEFRKRLLESESNATQSYYSDFYILNSEKISKEEYEQFKGSF